MKNKAWTIIASTLGSTFTVAFVTTFWPALGTQALIAAAAIGGFVGHVSQDPRRSWNLWRPRLVGSFRLATFLAPQLAAIAAVALLSWWLMSSDVMALDHDHPSELVRWWFAACATIVPIMLLLPTFMPLCERRPLAMFGLADTSQRVRAILGKAGIFKSFRERSNLILVGRQPAWRTPFRSKRFSTGDYLVAGASIARIFGLAGCVIVLVCRGIEWALGYLIASEYGFIVDYAMLGTLGAVIGGSMIYMLALTFWTAVTSVALKLREKAQLCAGAGASLGAVTGLVASAYLGIWGVPILATFAGALSGAMCGWLAVVGSDGVLWLASRYTPSFLVAKAT